MKISIITVVLNRADTIGSCLKSVAEQKYHDIEHIIIDGGSSDGTLEIIGKYKDSIHKIVSEKDNGIYDAMNKGIINASGDVIGFLNADDVYADDSILHKVKNVMKNSNLDACYGDLVYVKRNNVNKVVRFWKSPDINRGNLKKNLGLVPPHPTFFVRKRIYKLYGGFDTDFKLSADHELMIRLLYKCGIKVSHVSKVLVKMRLGGVTNISLKNIINANKECYRAWKKNGLKINPITYFFMKPFPKIFQYRYTLK